jgi:hypothetical protein
VAEMNLFVMSAYETDAETFFTSIRNHHIDLVVDVRRRNTSQLCGFTRQKDLPYFLKELTGADYIHDLNLVPSEELLEAYLKKQSRKISELIFRNNTACIGISVCLVHLSESGGVMPKR